MVCSVFLITVLFDIPGCFCVHPTRKSGSLWWDAEFVYEEEKGCGVSDKIPGELQMILRWLSRMINVIDSPWSKFSLSYTTEGCCRDQKEAHSPPSTSLFTCIQLQDVKNCTDMQKSISQNEVQIYLLKSQIAWLCRDNLPNSPCILLFILYLRKVKGVSQIIAWASEHSRGQTRPQRMLRSLSMTPFFHLHPAKGAYLHSHQHTARKYTISVVENELT